MPSGKRARGVSLGLSMGFALASGVLASCASAVTPPPAAPESSEQAVNREKNDCFQAFIELRRYKSEWGRQLEEHHRISRQDCQETFPTARADAPTASPSCEGFRFKDLTDAMRSAIAELRASGSGERAFAPNDSVSWIFVTERDETLKMFERDCAR